MPDEKQNFENTQIIVTNEWLTYLKNWYESYEKIIKYVGIIAITILFFTSNFIFKEIILSNKISNLSSKDLSKLIWGIVFFGISLFLNFICLLSTYNWYIEGVNYLMRKLKIDFREAGDNFFYRKGTLTMGVWGWISFVTGLLSGVTLVLGIIIYMIGTWDIFNLVLNNIHQIGNIQNP